MAGDRAPSFSAVATDPLLCVEGLHQHYGGSHILRGIDLDLRAGEVTVLLGRNGVGKTTLLTTLMGVVPCSQGHIRGAGHVLAGLPSPARVGAGCGS
ncbi:MAG: ATP-binding cassette domain-containing protein, partial [Inhella sp.]|uniref:ATP-binding cassette domain-containing protein n=1 Tax=Inhella sp. TaxID=1921806 RepID=UPI00391A1127